MSRIPTQAEMRDWYLSIRELPGAVALREQIGNEAPRLQILTTTYQAWRATTHATIDGFLPLCGRVVRHFKLEAPGFMPIGCIACRRTVDEEEYEA